MSITISPTDQELDPHIIEELGLHSDPDYTQLTEPDTDEGSPFDDFADQLSRKARNRK